MPGGRPKKPAALKILEGNRGRRKLPENEPKPPLSAPECPARLKGLARKVFKSLASQLDELNLISPLDALALEGAAVAFVEAVEAGEVIDQLGMVMEIPRYDKDGNVMSTYYQQRPEVSIRNQAWQRFCKFVPEFGLSIKARGQLSVGETGKTISTAAELIG